jgi:hypothetical protein
MSNNFNLVDELINNVNNIKTPKDMLPYFKHINNLMIDKDFNNYNHLLKNKPVSNMCESLLIDLLSLANVWREHITEWNNFLQKTYVELNNRGYGSREMLTGVGFVNKTYEIKGLK